MKSYLLLFLFILGDVLFQGGSGYVQGVRFQNVKMEDVANPIIIDQFYCDSPKSCENQVSSKFLSTIFEISSIYQKFQILTKLLKCNELSRTTKSKVWILKRFFNLLDLPDIGSEHNSDYIQEYKRNYKERKGNEILLQRRCPMQQHSPDQHQLGEERWDSGDLLQLCSRLWIWDCSSFSWLPQLPRQELHTNSPNSRCCAWKTGCNPHRTLMLLPPYRHIQT